ncbi:MAG: RpoL/Rpb11 RNA polymerase subunit family protein [Candidatus Thermoplasmatota archaeon]
MEIRKIKKTTKQIEIEIKDENETILNPLKEVLLEDKNVDYATVMSEHPQSNKRTLYLRLKKGKKATPIKVLTKSIERLEDEVKKFKKNFE